MLKVFIVMIFYTCRNFGSLFYIFHEKVVHSRCGPLEVHDFLRCTNGPLISRWCDWRQEGSLRKSIPHHPVQQLPTVVSLSLTITRLVLHLLLHDEQIQTKGKYESDCRTFKCESYTLEIKYDEQTCYYEICAHERSLKDLRYKLKKSNRILY